MSRTKNIIGKPLQYERIYIINAMSCIRMYVFQSVYDGVDLVIKKRKEVEV